MNTLSEKSRQHLGKVLALLESEHPGERDAAVRAASRILKQNGMRWCQVLEALPPPPPAKREPAATWRSTCRELARRPGSLRVWERKFIRDLPAFPRISAKQRNILDEIAERVLRRGAAA